MGEYEDRYPDAYGRDEAAAPPSRPEERIPAPPLRPGREWRLLRRAGAGAATETTAAPAPWQHARSETAQMIEPTAPPNPDRNYRGIGPRGYVRSPTRIYEDICDRLTEHPLIDASDIEVLISGIEVVLAGSVDSAVIAARVEAIAREVPGVKTVRNTLEVRSGGQVWQR